MKAVTFEAGDRWYISESRKEGGYWSVTTLLQVIAKPQLMMWAASMAAQCAVREWAFIARLIRRGRAAAAIKYIATAADRYRDYRADLGSHIHRLVEAWMNDAPMPDWPDEVRPYMEAFYQFLLDHDGEIKVLATEATVFNHTHRYAGRLDLILRFPKLGRTLVVDVKTGKSVYDEVSLQLAAYAHAEWMEPGDGRAHPLPKIDGGAVLHLHPDKLKSREYTLLPVRIDDVPFTSFLYARELYRWKFELTAKKGNPNPMLGRHFGICGKKTSKAKNAPRCERWTGHGGDCLPEPMVADGDLPPQWSMEPEPEAVPA